MHDLWIELARCAGLSLSEAQDELLGRYIDLLLDANQRMNLTRINTRASAEVLHIGDALTLLPFMPAGQLQLADVGSGGGVPGIPLAIVRPGISVTLIESTKKKAKFLSETIGALGLMNVRVLAERAEEIAHPGFCSRDARVAEKRNSAEEATQASQLRVSGERRFRESFDIVTVRALAEMSLLVEWCLPLMRVGGKLLAMKGARVHEELPRAARAIQLLGGANAALHRAALPGAEDHVIVEIRKIATTPLRFPRATAISKREPI